VLPEDVEVAAARQAISRVIAALDSLLLIDLSAPLFPWQSRWNGIVELEEVAFHSGVIRPDGTIGILRPVWDAGGAVRYRTLIHEALHSFSPLMTPRQYQDMIGWEEGVVESLQRLLRQAVLRIIGLAIPDADFAAIDESHKFNPYLAVLEELRAGTSLAATEFYVRLLSTPVGQRVEIVGRWREGEAFPDVALVVANARLRRPLHGF
jgi:hypothetical protein